MNTFYNEIADHFQGYLRDDVIDAIELACVTGSEWENDPDDCLDRVTGAIEELFTDDLPEADYDPDWAQEWYDFDPEC